MSEGNRTAQCNNQANHLQTGWHILFQCPENLLIPMFSEICSGLNFNKREVKAVTET